MEDDRYTRITLRIPKTLHADLQKSADATSKSMNAEIISRLSRGPSSAENASSDDIMMLMYQLSLAASKKGLVLDIRVSHKLMEEKEDDE